ncbi:MAG: ABC transporter ATP-binding protein, partial [Planctomycetota bacterium]|nr:ABC transporter ATP-binding protein [Planctomycetota bacterium]
SLNRNNSNDLFTRAIGVSVMSVSVHVQDLRKRFAKVEALKGVNLKIAPGKIHVLLGPSGCGKTTLLRSIAGFERPDSGSIDIGERRVHGKGVYIAPENRAIGMVFQDYALFPHLSIEKNVAFGVRDKAAKEQRIVDCLGLTQMTSHRKKMPHALSGGEQQRIALARALAPRPGLILLDEPFSNLDAKLRVQIRGEIKSIIQNVGSTAIFVTHDQEEALSLADTVSVMFGGEVVQSSDPATLYHRPVSRQVAEFVGQANVIHGHAKGHAVETILGHLELHEQGYGPMNIMLRPEQLEASEDDSGPWTLQSQEFLGDRQVLRLSSKKSDVVTVTQWSWKPRANSQRMSLKVHGRVHGWPA